jgi:hypothetical protein
MDMAPEVLTPRYKPAVVFALCCQMVVGGLALLALDGGYTARVVGTAALAFWLATAIVAAGRPHNPKALDLAWVRWGFWPILAVSGWVAVNGPAAV